MTSQLQSGSPSQSQREPVTIDTSTDRPDWDAYLNGHGQATIYHDARWGEVMRASYGNAAFYMTARRGGKIVGVLQLIWQKSLLWGSHLCSMPYFDASGILADDIEAEEALIGATDRLAKDMGSDWVELRQVRPLDNSFPTRTDKVTLRLPLAGDSAGFWKELKDKVRNQVRKAEKAELTADEGGPELLEDFHAVYSRNMRDLGSPPHGRRFFRLIAESFQDSIRLFVVRQGRQAVAAALTLRDKHAVHVPWAGSDWRQRKYCPTMLLYWKMLAVSCDTGAPCFDFGRSTPDEGTFRFKTQWGAKPVPLYWHFLMPEGKALPDLRPDSPKYRFMVACWKKLPVCMAQMIGPRIIAKLS